MQIIVVRLACYSYLIFASALRGNVVSALPRLYEKFELTK
jgi:hypothetical protein